MHNQLEQFKSSLLKTATDFGEYFISHITNSMPNNIVLYDFNKNYPDLDNFKNSIANKLPSLKKQTDYWNILLNNDLKIIYAHNCEFIQIYDGIICIAEAEDYLLKNIYPNNNQKNYNNEKEPAKTELRQSMLNELEKLKKAMINQPYEKQEMKAKPKKNKETHFKLKSLNEYNHISSVLEELKNHEVNIKGKKYYLVEHEMKSEFKIDIDEFYGKETGLEKTLNSLNYSAKFAYNCLINAETLQYEIVFNKLFAKYDYENKKLSINELDQIIVNEIQKLKNNPGFCQRTPSSLVPINFSGKPPGPII
jgi:hypothetical protein